jgi:hypothetical protein
MESFSFMLELRELFKEQIEDLVKNELDFYWKGVVHKVEFLFSGFYFYLVFRDNLD